MGLPVRQRRVLDHIDRTLRGSDPGLASLYAVFGRLTRDEEMPRIEQLRQGALAWLSWVSLILAAIGNRLHLHVRLRSRQRIILFYPLAVALAVGSIVVAARSGADRGCLPVRAVDAAKNVAKSTLCRQPSIMSPLTYGH